MDEVLNIIGVNAFDSIGYEVCTRAVIKNIVAYADIDDHLNSEYCSMERLYFSAKTRQPFREAYFAVSGLFFQKLVEGIVWTGVALVRGFFFCDVSKSWGLAIEALVAAVSNLASLFIAFIGMCHPKWGISLWLSMTKVIIESSGAEIINNITKSLIVGFDQLYPALVHNLGREETVGVDETCQVLKKNLGRIGKAIEDLKLWDSTSTSTSTSTSLKNRTLLMFSELIHHVKETDCE